MSLYPFLELLEFRISRFGISQVTVIFKEDVKILIARQLVSEKLQNPKKCLELASRGGLNLVLGA